MMQTVQEILDRTYDTCVTKSVTFAGGTTNDMGDFDGTGNPCTLFTVTGVVSVKLFAKCTTNVAGASSTLSVGTALSNASLIALTTATGLAANEIWHDNSPDASIELSSVLTERIVTQNIIQTAGTANVTSGALTYYCIWKPISAGSSVTAA